MALGDRLALGNRLASFRVTGQYLVESCKGHDARSLRVVANWLPPDAVFFRAGHDRFGDLFIVVGSSEFAELKDGDEIPILAPPTFEVVRD